MISFKTSCVVSGVWLLNPDQAIRHSLYKIVIRMVSTIIKVALKQKLGSYILQILMRKEDFSWNFSNT